ncbi:hypothetical protein JCM10207_001919 [Rhodosporidiobolus poonsookiae]
MAFVHQVGGHAATILASPLSSSTLIKPACAKELDWYQRIAPALLDGDFLATWTPAFYGTLKLQGKMGDSGAVEKLDTAGDEEEAVEPEMLVLENLTYRFVHPNVLDIKLGMQLYDEDASEEKQARMRKAAQSSTSGEAGVRLTGFQVWDNSTSSYVQTPKPFGRTLTVPELPLGLSRFFYPPLSGPSAAETSDPTSFPLETQARPPPLPLEMLLPVLRTLARRLDDLERVMQTLEVRMRGASLLIVVEGDAQALEAALLRAQASQTAPSENGDEADDASVSTTDSAGDAAPHTRQALDVRLIDFAHSRAVRPELGETGPDEGVLKGIGAVRGLVKGLVGELEELERKEEAEGK